MRYKYIITFFLTFSALFLSKNLDAQVKTKIFKDSIPSHLQVLKTKIKKESPLLLASRQQNLSFAYSLK